MIPVPHVPDTVAWGLKVIVSGLLLRLAEVYHTQLKNANMRSKMRPCDLSFTGRLALLAHVSTAK